MVDHRASPGLTEDEARRSGFDPKHCGEGGLFEAATLTCAHCKCTVVKNPARQRERPFCRKCMHYICDGCHAVAQQPDYQHASYEGVVERQVIKETLGSPPALIIPK